MTMSGLLTRTVLSLAALKLHDLRHRAVEEIAPDRLATRALAYQEQDQSPTPDRIRRDRRRKMARLEYRCEAPK